MAMDRDTMHLGRDVLDKQMLDELRDKMGKVDGLVLELREGEPPRLSHVAMGGAVLAARLKPSFGAWLAKRRPPLLIPWERVRDVGLDIEVNVCRDDTPAMRVERWLRERVVARIPGSGTGAAK